MVFTTFYVLYINIYVYIYTIVQNTSKTYHYSLFHPEGEIQRMKQTVVVSF